MKETSAFPLLFDHNPQPMWIFAQDDLRILVANQAAAKLYSCNLADFKRLYLGDFQPGQSTAQLRETWIGLTGDSPRTSVVHQHARNGSELDVEVTSQALDFAEQPARLALLVDVTGLLHKGHTHALLTAERDQLLEELQLVMERMPLGCLINNPQGRIAYWNPTAEKIFGYRAEEVLGLNTDTMLVPPHEIGRVAWVRRQLAAGEANVHSVNQNLTRNGRTIICEWDNTPLRSDDGQFCGFLAMVRDITEQKHTAQALEESERRFRGLFEDSATPIWLQDYSLVKQNLERWTRAGITNVRSYLLEHPEELAALFAQVRVLEVNQAALEMHHAPNKETLSQRFLEAFLPESAASLAEVAAGIAAGQSVFILDTRLRALDGQLLWVNMRWQAARGHEALADQVLLSLVDVSQRKKREADQTRSLARLQLLTRAALEINRATDLTGLLRSAVEWCQHITGAPLAAVSLSEEGSEHQRIYVIREGQNEVPHLTALVGQRMTRAFFKRLFALGKAQHIPHGQLPPWILNEAGPLREILGGNYLGVPLIGQSGRGLGVLHLGDAPGAPFDASDEALATQLGLITAEALEKQNLLDQLRHAEEHMRELARQVISAQEKERLLIARELHDETGQNLTALKLSLQLAAEDLPTADATVQHQLRDSVALVETMMNQTRELAHILRPPRLEAIGLRDSLEGLCIDFSKRLRIPITYQGCDVPEMDDLMALSIYRLVQEALTNVARHAQASSVRVNLACLPEQIEVTVEDDGGGFDPAGLAEHNGMGLRGMQERIEMLNGVLAINSRHGRGTRLNARVPMRAAV
jgi:PAS domain S-box-containing protein